MFVVCQIEHNTTPTLVKGLIYTPHLPQHRVGYYLDFVAEYLADVIITEGVFFYFLHLPLE